MKRVRPGIYKHYKGGMYEVFGEGRHTETDEEFVVYKPLYKVSDPGKYQLRPKRMFSEKVEVDNQEVPRFKYIKEKSS